MRAALVTWGDPSGWREASYRKCAGDRAVTGMSVLSCTDAERILLFVQDSVIVPTTVNHGMRNEAYQRCRAHTLCGAPVDDYGEWVERVREYVRCAVGVMVPEVADRVRVIVVPSKGTLSDKVCGVEATFEGSPDVMYSVGLLQAYGELVDAAGDDGQLELTFDMTHGINYFTHIAARVARDVASALSVVHGDVRVSYRGAIPIVMNREYEMRDVLSTETPRISPDAYKNDGLDVWTGLTRFALRANAPLLLLRSLEGRGAEGSLADVPGQLGSLADVRRDGNVVKVDYRFREIPAALKKPGVAYLAILRDAIRRRLRPAGGPEYPLDALNRVKDAVFSRISEPSHVIVEAELENVGRAAELLKDGECREYRELIPYERSQQQEAQGPGGPTDGARGPRGTGALSRDFRNFAAHAGLLKELTYVCRRAGVVYLGYKDDALCESLGSWGVMCPWAGSAGSARTQRP